MLNENKYPESMYNNELDWVYNVRGLDGGWIIANANSVDAYRLALQYGVSDAVIAGSNAASIEGVASEHSAGYIWQPYCLGEWDQLKSVDPEIAHKIAEQRVEWQRLGVLSSRKYAALIIFTWSGISYEGQKDFLEARVFGEKRPDGSDHEIYIMTSELGASKVRERAHLFGLHGRIEEMLIVMPPRAASPTDTLSADIDIALVPQLLHDKYGMRIVNHDGGQTVLREFCRAGAMSQMNITLCRHQSQRDVIATSHKVKDSQRAELLENFDSRLQYFFSSPGEEGGAVCRGIPAALRPVCVISDDKDEVAVVTFDTRGGVDFHQE